MSVTKTTSTLNEEQNNCPHPNIEVMMMTPEDPKTGKRMVMSMCRTCNAIFWKSGKDGNNNIITDFHGCVECNSKNADLNMLRGVTAAADTPPSPPVEEEEKAAPPPIISSDRISDIIISHDEDDPKFQRYPQYAPGYQPKDGDEEVDKRGNPVNRKKKGIS